jgi:hypothetical protein
VAEIAKPHLYARIFRYDRYLTYLLFPPEVDHDVVLLLSHELSPAACARLDAYQYKPLVFILSEIFRRSMTVKKEKTSVRLRTRKKKKEVVFVRTYFTSASASSPAALEAARAIHTVAITATMVMIIAYERFAGMLLGVPK